MSRVSVPSWTPCLRRWQGVVPPILWSPPHPGVKTPRVRIPQSLVRASYFSGSLGTRPGPSLFRRRSSNISSPRPERPPELPPVYYLLGLVFAPQSIIPNTLNDVASTVLIDVIRRYEGPISYKFPRRCTTFGKWQPSVSSL